MSLREAAKRRRHLQRTAFGAVQVSNLLAKLEIASVYRPRNDGCRSLDLGPFPLDDALDVPLERFDVACACAVDDLGGQLRPG